MKIHDLELFPIELPWGWPGADRRSLIVRIEVRGGPDGWGETRWSDSFRNVRALRESLLGSLAGRSVADVSDLPLLEALEPAELRFAVEMACWDALGRRCKLPLADLWGGMFRERVPLVAQLPPSTGQELVTQARQWIEQGYGWLAMIASGDLEHDLLRLAQVRERIPGAARLALDGACRFSMEDALILCQRLDTDMIQALVDPIERPSPERLAQLRSSSGAPLAPCESIASAADMLRVVRSGCSDMALADPARCGGLLAARDVVCVAAAASLRVSLVGPPSSGLGVAARLQLMAAMPALDSALACRYEWLEDDLLTDPFQPVDGMLIAPSGAGLGVEVDRAKLERWSID